MLAVGQVVQRDEWVERDRDIVVDMAIQALKRKMLKELANFFQLISLHSPSKVSHAHDENGRLVFLPVNFLYLAFDFSLGR